VPYPACTETIKAFLTLAEGQQPSKALEQEIREFVTTRLARHEYARDRVRGQLANDDYGQDHAT